MFCDVCDIYSMDSIVVSLYFNKVSVNINDVNVGLFKI